MSIRLIIDSAADLTKEQAARDGIIVIPMKTQFGDETFLDGETLAPYEFYEKLVESDTLPKTSQLTPYDFEGVYQEIADAGDQAIVLCLSSKLSGSYQNAALTATDYEGIIYPIDTEMVSVGEHLLLDLALRRIAEGVAITEIVEELNQAKKKICLVALLDTLEYLKKGGRINAAAATIGEMLSIKPVVAMKDGEIIVLGKARGSKKGNNMLVEQIQAHGGIDFTMPLWLGFTGLSDHLLQKYIEDSALLWEGYRDELPISYIGSTIGTHVGPGAIAIAFFYK